MSLCFRSWVSRKLFRHLSTSSPPRQKGRKKRNTRGIHCLLPTEYLHASFHQCSPSTNTPLDTCKLLQMQTHDSPCPGPGEVVFPLFCDCEETEYEMTAGQANYKSFDTCFRGLCPAFLGLLSQDGLGEVFISPAVAAPALLAPPK